MTATPDTGQSGVQGTAPAEPKAIGGWLVAALAWLIAVTLGSAIGAFLLFFGGVMGPALILLAFDEAREGALSFVLSLLLLSVLLFVQFVFGLYCALRFLRRSRRAPGLMTAFNILAVATALVYSAFVVAHLGGIPFYEIFAGAISIAWIAYFRQSRRVRTTFVN